MTRCRSLRLHGLVVGCCLLLAASRTFAAAAIGALVLGIAAGLATGRWLVLAGGAAIGGVLLWLRHECGGVGLLNEGSVRLANTFDRFDAALPLGLFIGCAALWLIIVPAGEALRRGPVDREKFLLLWLVPIAGVAAVRTVVGGLVAREASAAGWSVWQDTVAQCALPMGAVAAVVCGAGAIGRDSHRAIWWTTASAGGLLLMGVGRADNGGLSAGVMLFLAQIIPLAAWHLIHERGNPPRIFGRVIMVLCSASLAGIWPLPGGLARWNLLDEMARGGFGVPWDGLLFWANVLSWAMAAIAWLPWLGERLGWRRPMRA